MADFKTGARKIQEKPETYCCARDQGYATKLMGACEKYIYIKKIHKCSLEEGPVAKAGESHRINNL